MGKHNNTSKKIKKLITDDRPQKLKSHFIRHQIDMDQFRFSNSNTLLHYSVKKSSVGVLLCLLRMNVDAFTVNDKGQTALDLAIRKALKSKKSTALKIYEAMVVPLVDYQSSQKDQVKSSNKLKQLQNKLFSEDVPSQKSNFYVNIEDSSSSETEDEEKRWREKLCGEYEDEHMSTWGTYEQDYTDEGERETYDQWANRLHSEYKAKQYSNRYHPYSKTIHESSKSSKSDKESKQKQQEEKLKQRREELEKIYQEKQKKMKEISKQETKYKYEEHFMNLLKSKDTKTLHFCDIPWPFDSRIEEMPDILFCDLKEKHSDAYRKYLREQQVRWHPDKFLQNFGDHLDKDHSKKILDRVTEISQYLNKLTEKS